MGWQSFVYMVGGIVAHMKQRMYILGGQMYSICRSLASSGAVYAVTPPLVVLKSRVLPPQC